MRACVRACVQSLLLFSRPWIEADIYTHSLQNIAHVCYFWVCQCSGNVSVIFIVLPHPTLTIAAHSSASFSIATRIQQGLSPKFKAAVSAVCDERPPLLGDTWHWFVLELMFWSYDMRSGRSRCIISGCLCIHTWVAHLFLHSTRWPHIFSCTQHSSSLITLTPYYSISLLVIVY